MNISRVWAMPNSRTFSIKPIKEIIERHLIKDGVIIDPFSNNSKMATITNDLDPETDAEYHMDAKEFLQMFQPGDVDMVLYDPPYSPRQVSECYKKLNMTVDMKSTQSSYWGDQKKEIGRIVRTGGKVITCGWNSGGIGKSNGFEIIEVLIVPHGGWHNDTIVTVEQKI
ncbi:MAG: adenine-specific DNA methylase [Aerococcus urinaeequi]